MEKYCPQCGSTGRPIRITKGSFLIEVIAWLSFLIPGIIYSLWRLSSRYEACPVCRQPGVIPLGSPKAAAALGPIGAQAILHQSSAYRLGKVMGKLWRTDTPSSAGGPTCPQCQVLVARGNPICPRCGQRVRLSRPA